MKKLLQDFLFVFIITIIILLSYGYIQGSLKSFHPKDIYRFFTYRESDPNKEKKTVYEPYRAVWLTYLEFSAFQRSAETNDEESFKAFYQQIIDRCKELHMTHIIVQVRPFGDALYQSDYYPWASCISGQQGKSPGYDPLDIMVKLTHDNNMKIEAWINPYRISTGEDIKDLSEDNPARKWAEDKETLRNVLTYEHALYYNPSSKQVRSLIINGIREIVSNYDVDGIHMDDYFYPTFTEKNVNNSFDGREFKKGIKNGDISQNMTIEEWRRYNVNQLVSGIYKTVKKTKPSVTFGISPSGNPAVLRSDLQCYADIDTWVSKDGYIDYIMPQIYWGYTNEEAPFKDILSQWKTLCNKQDVTLYAGLQLYRLGISDNTLSDYKELQTSDVIKKQIRQVLKDSEVQGYCLFSYQYLDPDEKVYHFDSDEFSEERKKILREIAEYLK